jgi:hypothetical protein|tara:strand:- start:478 stop:657 length:180 start_codon:yes stop_codon:yes gene_type:complete
MEKTRVETIMQEYAEWYHAKSLINETATLHLFILQKIQQGEDAGTLVLSKTELDLLKKL